MTARSRRPLSEHPVPAARMSTRCRARCRSASDLSGSRSLPEDLRERLGRFAGRRLTRDGVIVIIAQRYRTRERNRQDALDRLIALIRRAAVPPVPRRPTKPSRAAKERRLQAKAKRSAIKELRRGEPD